MNKDLVNILLHCTKSCIISIQAHAADVTEEQYRALREPYEALLDLQKQIVFGEEPKPSDEWTRSFHGVSHFGALSTVKTWLTVVDYGSFAELHIHSPGSGFSPAERRYSTVAAAKTAGEKIMEKS